MLQRVRSGLHPRRVGAVPQYRVLREGGMRATLVGALEERYSTVDVFVRRDIEQLLVGSEEHLEENIVEVYSQ